MGKSGTWIKKENSEIVFREVSKASNGITPIIEEKTPEEVGLVKQAEFDVYFMREIEDPDSFSEKTKVFFVQHMKMKIREAFNLWLKFGDNRQYFVTDILNNQTIRAPFESDNTLIVEKSKPKKVSVEIVREAMHD